MSVAVSQGQLTEAEYLRLERQAEFKSEFFAGELFAMAGGTHAHSLIATNLAREFGIRLKGRPWVTYNSDLRVKVSATGLITYPDISVVFGEQQFLDLEQDTLLNPILIAEVLSDTTEAYDRGVKFAHYRLIPSLRHFLLVSQREPRIECYTHMEREEWRLKEAREMEGVIELPELQITLSLAEVFAQVNFPSGPGYLRVK